MSAYKAFLSYSHQADREVARMLQSGLQKFAKPFYRRRAISIYRDQTDMSASAALWPNIQAAIRDAEFFLLLASPSAARSVWVRREIEYWLELHDSSVDRILIAWTDGDLAWDDATGDFDWQRTDALPQLPGRFATVPFYVDERWMRGQKELSNRDPRFQDDLATLASALHQRKKSELIGEDLKEHRRYRIARNSAAAALLIFAIATGIAARLALRERNSALAALQRETAAKTEAEHQRSVAQDREKEAVRQKNIAEENELRSQRHLYAVHINLAQKALLVGNLMGVDDMLHAHLPQPGKPDLRGFEWYYVWRQVHRERLTLAHENKVWDVRFSPDGRVAATVSAEESAGSDYLLTLWDARSGRRLCDFPFRGSRKGGFAFLPGGEGMAVVEYNQIRFVDMQGKPMGKLDLPIRSIAKLAFLPGTRTLAIVEGSGLRRYPTRLLIHDLGQQKTLVDTSTGLDEPTGLAVSPDGKVAGVMNQHVVNLISTEDGRRIDRVIANTGECLAFSPDGKLLAIGFVGGYVKLFDTGNWKESGEIRAHSESVNVMLPVVTALTFSPDGKTLATGSWDHSVRLSSVESRKPLYSMRGHRNNIEAVAFGPDGATLATASADGTARVWSAAQDPSVFPERLVGDEFDFLPDGKTMLIAGYDEASQQSVHLTKHLKFLDVRSMRETGRIPLKYRQSMGGPLFSLSPEGRLLALGQEDGIIALYDTRSRKKTGELRGLSSYDPTSMRWSPDSKWLSATNINRSFRMWDVGSGRVLRASDSSGESVVVFSPDGRRVCQEAGGIVCKGSESGNAVWEFRLKDYVFGTPFFSPDGTFLAATATYSLRRRHGPTPTTADQYMVKVWDMRTGAEAATLRGHVQQVRSLSFSPDGRTLATGGQDGTVKLWSVPTWQELLTLQAHEKQTEARVGFSPDGGLLVTAAMYELKFWYAER